MDMTGLSTFLAHYTIVANCNLSKRRTIKMGMKLAYDWAVLVAQEMHVSSLCQWARLWQRGGGNDKGGVTLYELDPLQLLCVCNFRF